MDKFLEILRIIIGSAFILYLPGHFLSFLFFKKGKIDTIERIGISFAISITVVPLLVFYLNFLGVKISTISVMFEILGVCFISQLYLYFKDRNKK